MTSTPDSFLLGNSFVRSPSSYISPSSRKTANRRFFESVPAGTQQQSGSGISNSSSNEVQSEIDLGQIRALAMSAMGTESSSSSPEMAVFYCSILFSKTQSGADAYFYASALYRNREYRRAVRVLDEFLDDNLEAALLACQCLSEIGEWQEASQLLQEASRLPQSTTILLDEDENGWEALYKMFPVKSGDIHVVARLCHWRAKCYDAISHPPRAKLFWKRALQFDYQCMASLDFLLDRNLLTSVETINLVDSLIIPKSMDWLKQIYYARIPLIVSENSESDNPSEQPSSFLNGQDASSIQMSPSMSFGDQQSEARDLFDTSRVEDAMHNLFHVYRLNQCPEVLALAAVRAYRQYDLQSAFNYCQELIRIDPLTPLAAFVHAATLLALDYKRLLFVLAHEWVKASPQSAKSWFAVGCYYFCCKRYHVAQQHFQRATRLDPLCTDAWIAFGCSFAACDESDQALASFRAAQRLAPADSAALLYMGMEYIRTNHLVLAHHALRASLPGGNPLCWHEMGVVYFSKKEYDAAISWFRRTLSAVVRLEKIGSENENPIILVQNAYWEPTLFNLGHAYRKTLQFDLAEQCYEHCSVLVPDNPSALTALGFTKQLKFDLEGAIDCYHQALALKSDDSFCTEMLSRALEESLSDKLVIHKDTMKVKRRSNPFGFDNVGHEEDDVDMIFG